MSHNLQEVIDELHRGRELLTSTSGTQGTLSQLSEVISDVSSQLSKYCSDDAWIATINLKTAQYIIDNITRGCITAYNNANDELIIRIQGHPAVANTATQAIGALAVRQYITEVTILKAWVTEQKERWRTRVIHPTTDSVYGLAAGNLATDRRTNHILYGTLKNIQYEERPNIIKGHLYPGVSGKNAFPKEWTARKILKVASKIAIDSSTIWLPDIPSEKTIDEVQSKGESLRSRWQTTETIDGIEVNVIVEPSGEGIITSYPTRDYKHK